MRALSKVIQVMPKRLRRRVDALRATTAPAAWGPLAESVDGDTLIAYDLTRRDWRSFRLDRVAAPRATGSRFGPRDLPADDAAAFVRSPSATGSQFPILPQ